MRAVGGVDSATVNFGVERAVLTYDPDLLDTDGLTRARRPGSPPACGPSRASTGTGRPPVDGRDLAAGPVGPSGQAGASRASSV